MTEACEREARSLALEKAYVHQVYQQISDNADSFLERDKAWPKVKQFLSDLEPGSLVCDVGCGNGKYLDVNPSVFKVGIDRCTRLTEVARKKDHEVLICDNLALPFRDESFDAVLSIAVVHHLATTDRRVQALKELARVLKIGGKLIISVWAMEQKHRKFESQDVLVPWHRPQQHSTPSLEFTSTTTTSEDDGPPAYHAYTQSDSESARSLRREFEAIQRLLDVSTWTIVIETKHKKLLPKQLITWCHGLRKRGRHCNRGRSIDPSRPLSSSQSSSSLSSPNETCYSFVRRALQKLAGGKRGSSGRHRPWFLDTWTSCTKEPTSRPYDPDGCEDMDFEDIQDLPIELRRLDEESDLPQRRQTFACSEKLSSSIEISLGCKSKSLSDIVAMNDKCMAHSRSTATNLGAPDIAENSATDATTVTTTTETTTDTTTATTTKVVAVGVVTSQPKPKLIKQKQSLCEDEIEEEGGDIPTDMKDMVKKLPDFKVSVSGGPRKQGNVFKQSSMNEELMSTERLREKEKVRQNIQKQASLNEEFLFRRQKTFDSLRDTLFSTSTAKKFQIFKDGLTNKIKNSTTGIEKVSGASIKNGFVRILQGWKSEGTAYPAKMSSAPPPSEIRRTNTLDEKITNGNNGHSFMPGVERRHSKEDGSDSSKDSSLQSDTSVDSEDSFASVIFVPKPDLTSETSPPMNTSPPLVALTSPTFHSLPQSPQQTSPKLKGSLPPSPKFKYQSPTSPIIKQPSLPSKYQSPTSPNLKTQISTSPIILTKQHSLPTSPKFKYSLSSSSPNFGKMSEPQLNFQPNLNLQSSQQKSLGVTSQPLQNSQEQGEVGTEKSKTPTSIPELPIVEVRTVEGTIQQLSEVSEPKEVAATGEAPKELRGAAEETKRNEAELQTTEVYRPRTSSYSRQHCFPLVRRASVAAGVATRPENIIKTLPKLMSLELFNPETDDADSDSSGVSSPDSISSVISVLTEELSVGSHDAQQAKISPSDGQSNSNSANDSDLNLSDQSLSSLPNSRSPEISSSKSPENASEGADKSKSADTSISSRAFGKKKFDIAKSSSKSLKSPENLSSSSDSLSKSPDFQKESEDSKSDEMTRADVFSEMEEDDVPREDGKGAYSRRSTSNSPDLLSIKLAVSKKLKDSNRREKMVRKRDEKYVAPACEMDDDKSSPTRRNISLRSMSPSKSLIEAATDVATSLEGAVDAAMQSSPKTKRRQMALMEFGDTRRVAEERSSNVHKNVIQRISPEKEDNLTKIFRKCESKQALKVRHETGWKKSPEYLSHGERYPDFKFCKIKCREDHQRKVSLDRYRSHRSTSIEKMPLLGSHDTDSTQGDSESELAFPTPSMERSRREFEMNVNVLRRMEAGSSWSLGRSERFYHSMKEAEKEEKRKNSSTWSLNRYKSICSPRARLEAEIGEIKKVSESPRPGEKPTVRIIREDLSGTGNRRSTRSHSLSLRSSRGAKDMQDKLAESWGGEYRSNLPRLARRTGENLARATDVYRDEAGSKHIYSSLPSGLERTEDSYSARITEQLLDLNRLSAELKERNNYLASLSDEDINKELSRSKLETNPFLPWSLADTSSKNPFSEGYPFFTDDSESERSKSDDSDAGMNKNFVCIDDSFIPLEIDSPPENGSGRKEQGRMEEYLDVDKALEEIEVRSVSSERLDSQSVKSCGSLTTSKDRRKNLFFVKSASLDDSYKFLGTKASGEKSRKTRDGQQGVKKIGSAREEAPTGKRTSVDTGNAQTSSLDSPRSQGKNYSTDSADFILSSWERSMDAEPCPGIQRDLSKLTIASSLGYSMESSDLEASGGTGSGSDCSRRDTSRVTASTGSLGHSIESSDPGDVSERTGSVSDFSRKETSSAGTERTADSTASFGRESGSDSSSRPVGYGRRVLCREVRSSSEEIPRRIQLVRQRSTVHEPLETLPKTESFDTSFNGSTSQESLPSDGGGGAITFHRYYHVFREGELDQLIEKYVDNLHIISSYYDHANWCIVAEKVQVWTI